MSTSQRRPVHATTGLLDHTENACRRELRALVHSLKSEPHSAVRARGTQVHRNKAYGRVSGTRRGSTLRVARAQSPGLGERRTARALVERCTSAIFRTPRAALSSRRTRPGAIIPTIDNTMFARGICSTAEISASVATCVL